MLTTSSLKTGVLGAVAALGLSLGATTADAATYAFDFSSSGGDLGHLILNVAGSTVTTISGVINGASVVSLVGFAAADQTFFAAGPVHFTVPGLSFVSLAGISYNLTAYPDNADRITNNLRDPGGNGDPTPVLLTSVSVSEVPLPASASLMLLALGAVGGAAMLRRKSDTGLAA